MIQSTELHAGTTPHCLDHRTPFDDALDDLRVTGAVLLHETYAPPWAIEVPEEAEMLRLLGLGADVRVLPFHLVRTGGLTLAAQDLHPVRVAAQEVAICPGGARHRISAGAGARVRPLESILSGQTAKPDPGGTGATELICGVFLVRAAPLNPLLAALPAVMTVPTARAGANPILARVADILALELGVEARAPDHRGSFTAKRLLEIFCAEAIETYRQTEGSAAVGWFRGLADERIGRAIAAIHQAPGQPWTVASLADAAGMSPSRFAARFRAGVGQSVMTYVSAWRINAACRMLEDTDSPLARVAASVGYNDAASFSRAFNSLVGAPPAHWRETRRLSGREPRALR